MEKTKTKNFSDLERYKEFDLNLRTRVLYGTGFGGLVDPDVTRGDVDRKLGDERKCVYNGEFNDQ